MESLESFMSVLDKVQGLSAAALTVFTCIVVGYILRFAKSFPNDGIPVVVILWGALFFMVLADPRAASMTRRVWAARNLGVGLVLGFIAWFAHKIVLAKLEDFIVSKFPNLTGTTFFKAKDVPPIPPVDPNAPKP